MLGDTCPYAYLIFDTFWDNSKRSSGTIADVVQPGHYIEDGGAASTAYTWVSTIYTDVVGSANHVENVVLHADLKEDGSGTIKIEVSCDNGGNYLTIYETGVTDNRDADVSITNQGDDVIVRITITTDGSGDGGRVYSYGLLMDEVAD